MRVAEARSRCAALEVLPWEGAVIDRAIVEATAAFVLASPQVTPVPGAPGMWWIGAGGFESLGGERVLGRALLRIARAWHPAARVAIADSCVAARAATWAAQAGGAAAEGAGIVPAGGCAGYLAPAPLTLLPMDDELRETLAGLGLRTVGAFAALDAGDVERRWGDEGLAAWRLAHGDDRRRPVLARSDAPRSVTAELGAPTPVMEPVLFLVRAALDRLVAGLVADGRAAAAVAITLTLDDGRGPLPSGGTAHTITREVRCPRALARVAPLFEHCRGLLDRWTLEAPVCGVAVTITATAPASAEQGSLLDTAWRDPMAADAAFARLRAQLGPGVVVRPVARDAHRPERAGAWVDDDEGRGTRDESLSARPTGAALRLLESPEPVEVECPEGVPAALNWRGSHLPCAYALGPERLAGDWWTPESYRRDYWRCDASGRELLLFQDRATAEPNWFVHGWYD